MHIYTHIHERLCMISTHIRPYIRIYLHIYMYIQAIMRNKYTYIHIYNHHNRVYIHI